MKQERIYQILSGSHISEKAARESNDHSRVVFKVTKTASKIEIKKAVEKLFDVNVVSVATLIEKGKKKKGKHGMGKCSDVKKAYVSLKKGQEIDFMEQESRK